MSESVAPNAPYTSRIIGLPAGLAGTVRFRLVDDDGTADDPVYGPSTTGIIEDPTGSGSYLFRSTAASTAAPSTAGKYTRLWDTGAGTDLYADEDMVVRYSTSTGVVSAANEYVGADTLKATLNLAGETYADDDVLAAVVAASRQIDQWCGRRFYKDSSDTTRYYTPIRPGRLNIHDLADLTSVSVDQDSDGTFETTWTENTEFTFDPLNAETDGWPRTAIRVVPRSGAYLPCEPRAVKVVGRHGWDTVPPAVVQATTILASRLLKRARETPYGISAVGLEGEAVRISAIDPDVNALIQPYKRLTAV